MEYIRNMTFSVKGVIKRLNCSFFFLLFSFIIQAQPEDAPHDNFHSTNGTDTLFNKREIIVRNAAMDTLEITGYKNGEKHGQQKLFYSNGDLKLIANYKKGLLNGKVEYFAQFNHQLTRVEHYKANSKQSISVLHGQMKNYFPNGRISEDFSYKNGEKNGLCKKFYEDENKSLKSKTKFKKGWEHGLFVRYFKNGKIKDKGKYYLIPKIGKPGYNFFRNGRIISYYDNGMIKHLQHWKDYKRNGACESYSRRTGKIKKRMYFKDNIKTGIEERFDPEGVKNYEAHFKIVEINGKKVTQQTGLEISWIKGEIRTISTWANGVKNGVSKYYYENGQLERLINFKDGERDGLFQTYYKNGQLKTNFVYKRNKWRPRNQIGWEKKFDENGKLTELFYSNKDEENSVKLHFENGEQKEISVLNLIKITISKDKKIETINWIKNGYASFGYDMLGNQHIRSMHFKTNNYGLVTTNFSNDGQLIQSLNGTGQLIEDEKIDVMARKIAAQYNPNWNSEQLISDGFRDGDYQWNYADGSPFLKMEFKDSLPVGDWIMFNPILNDTLLKREYENNLPIGNWIEKTIYGAILFRRSYFPNHQVKEYYRYDYKGNLLAISKKDSLGKGIYYANYYENGQLIYENISSTNSYIYFSENGDTMKYSQLHTKNDSIRINRIFYDENAIKEDRKNNLSTGFGELKAYFKNGQLKNLYELKNNVTHGFFKSYDNSGRLTCLGHYEEGRKQGQWITYNIDGSIEMIKYNKGYVVK